MNLPAASPPAHSRASDPRRDMRSGLAIAALFFVGFLGWAALFPLDAASHASGTLEPAERNRVVEHREGGTLTRLLVAEGDRVEEGQPLLVLSDPGEGSAAEALVVQHLQQLARKARLEAELSGSHEIPIPASGQTMPAHERSRLAEMIAAEARALEGRQLTLARQNAAHLGRAQQARADEQGAASRRLSAIEQVRLIDEQIEALQPLAVKGYVSRSRMRELERARAALQGEIGQFAANEARARSEALAAALEAAQAASVFRERASEELREAEGRLEELAPRLAGARARLALRTLTAPSAGTVLDLAPAAPGEVIAPGEPIMRIVAQGTGWLCRLRISALDADDLEPGMAASLRFPGIAGRATPELSGTLRVISADALTDPRSATPYFAGEVTISARHAARFRAEGGDLSRLHAGIPVEARFVLRRRSALDYAFEPLFAGFRHAFSED